MSEQNPDIRTRVAETLEILRTHSLTTIVLQELERMILTGELKPGERINEKALAASQLVSRGPIREACRRLEQAGLVEIIVNRGVFVRKLKSKDAADLCDIRASLSALAGRALAADITADQLATLKDMVRRMEKMAAIGDVEAYYPLNVEFHDTILRFAGNERLAAMCAAIDKELYLFRRRSLHVGIGLDRSAAEHRKMIAALEARDAEGAAQVFAEHANTGKERLLGAMPDAADGGA
jgi:DNA-binding GntR family transcriptional regulator